MDISHENKKHLDIGHEHNELNDVLHQVEKKIWQLFSKEHHTFGEFCLLYLIVFTCLFCMMIIYESAH